MCNDVNESETMPEKDLVSDFLLWLTNLQRHDLEVALQIRIPQGPDRRTNCTAARHKTTTSSNVEPKRRQNERQNEGSECLFLSEQDYRLLLEMVTELPSPPIPIHPKATGLLKRATLSGADDGRDPEIMKRNYQKNRPRLFRWVEQQSSFPEYLTLTSNTKTVEDNNINHRRRNAMGGKRNKRSNINLQSKSDSIHDNIAEIATGSLSRKKLDVIARKFVTDDGERLSLACSTEQREADLKLFQGTVFKYDSDSCNTPYCIAFVPSDECNTNSYIKKMLWLVSRGNFGRLPLLCEMPASETSREDSLPNKKANSKNQNQNMSHRKKILRMQWFDPEDRWFSFSMYLAHLFEVALWHAFLNSLKHKQNSVSSVEAKNNCFEKSHIENSPTRRDPLLVKAIHQTMISIFTDSRKIDDDKYAIRDSLLWTILNSESDHLLSSTDQFTNNNIGLWVCPVLEIHSKTEQWRGCVRQKYCELKEKVQQEAILLDLLHQLETEEANNRNNDSDDTHRVVNKKLAVLSSSKKKGKNSFSKNSKVSLNSSSIKQSKNEAKATDSCRNDTTGLKSQEANETLSTIDSSTDSSTDNDEEDESHARSTLEEKKVVRFDFPANIKSPRDRNRNIVIAMCILEDVLENVFKQVLPTEEGSSVETTAADEVELSCDDEEMSFQVIYTASKRGNLRTSSVNGKKRSSSQDNRYSQLDGNPTNSDHEEELFANKSIPATDMRHPSNGSVPVNDSISPKLKNSSLKDHDSSDNQHQTFLVSPALQSDRTCDFQERQEVHAQHSISMLTTIDDSGATLKRANLDTKKSGYNWDHRSFFYEENDCQTSREHRLDYDCISTEKREQVPVTMSVSDIVSSAIIDDSNSRDDIAARRDHDSNLPCILTCISDLANVSKNTVDEHYSFDSQDIEPVSSFNSDPIGYVSISPMANQQNQSETASTLSRENLRAERVEDKVHSRSRDQSKKTRMSSPRPTKAVDEGSSRSESFGIQRTDRSRDDDDVKFNRTSALRRSADTRSLKTTKVNSSRDDQDVKTALRLSSYKGFITKPHPMYNSYSTINSYSIDASRRPPRNFSFESMHATLKDKDYSCRSETALEEQDEYQNLSNKNIFFDDRLAPNAAAKDYSTTISSPEDAIQHEMITVLREERNSYRDMCLTLGAEVAKLKNMLASQKNSSRPHSAEFQSAYGQFPIRTTIVFDPESVSHHAFQSAARARTTAAMSDAGCGIDHESLVSEDDAHRLVNGENILRQPSTITMSGSDASLDHMSTQNTIQIPFVGIKAIRDGPDPVSLNGMQSRLTKDIMQFLESINMQLRKLDGKRNLAVERMTRLVITLWPRAQVKLYGSHVTGLCLPSSDLDFVVCLPAVHKNTMAIAAGELEMRTAINESSQKLLARRLKGEEWIDPRSMKLIERTVVPVIKVSTKDSKARTLQLDITFDAPAHHGLEAVEMVTRIMDELPMIRPIIIVLKQFLIDRGLLTAYTGGLSSYCLFLMVTRYLQEQPSAWGDCGALLMGFLDFYGNCVSLFSWMLPFI